MAKQKIKESNPMSVQKGEAVFCYIVMAVICVIALFPIVWVVISSFKADLLENPDFLFLASFALMDIFEYLLNLVLVNTL